MNTYGGIVIHCDNVVGRRDIGGVLLSHVLHGGLSWIDDHGGAVDGPQNQTLVVRHDGAECNGESLCLTGKGSAGDVLRDLGGRRRVGTSGRSVGIWGC